MTINIISCLTQVASFLKVSVGKISLDSNLMPIRVENNSTTIGFVSIILTFLKEAKSNYMNIDVGNKSEIRQWLEYAVVYAIRADNLQDVNQLLKELNNILSTKTYFVSCTISIADVVMFYIMHHIMVNLPYLDKEKYLNVSRWFDNLQQDELIRQKK